MDLQQLKEELDRAIEYALECGQIPHQIPVTLQIDRDGDDPIWSSSEVELHYDNNAQATGCVLNAYWQDITNNLAQTETPEQKIAARDEQIRHLICHRERLKNDIDRLEARLQKIGDAMEKVIVTEGEDAGVVLLSNDAPTTWNEGLGVAVYDLQYFSPLGAALMALYQISRLNAKSDGSP